MSDEARPIPAWVTGATWFLVLCGNLALNRTNHLPSPTWAVLVEVLGVGALGLAATLGPRDRPTASPVLPLLWVTFLPTAWTWATEAGWGPVVPLLTALVLAGVAFGLHRLVSRAPGALWVVLVVPALLYSRWLTLQAGYATDPAARLTEQLAEPFTSRSVPTATEGPLVLVVVDTLRWDHGITMESYARLAARGAHWERAMSTASWTIPAMGSVFTGELPGIHGAGSIPGSEDSFSALDPDIAYLPTELDARGWSTAGFVANPILSRALGFSSGFDTYSTPVDRPAHPLMLPGRLAQRGIYDGDWLVDHAIDWVEDQPDHGWFLWLQLFEPHVPYEHAPSVGLPGIVDRDALRAVPEDQRDAVRAAYAHEVQVVDRQIGRLLDALEARGFFETGTLILTADHGEELWGHGDAEHGHTHHGEVVDVPLVVVGPSIPPGARTTVASLVDVHATLAARAGLPSSGLDLAHTIPADRTAFAAGNVRALDERSARAGELRAIRTCDAGREVPRVFDLALDPTEQRALPASHAPALVDAAGQVRTAAEHLDAAALNTGRLEALGYVHGDTPLRSVCEAPEAPR